MSLDLNEAKEPVTRTGRPATSSRKHRGCKERLSVRGRQKARRRGKWREVGSQRPVAKMGSMDFTSIADEGF